MALLSVYRKPVSSLAFVDDFFSDFNRNFFSQEAGVPADFVETDHGYQVTLDVPGLDREQISVEYRDGVLSIGGQRSAEKDKAGTKYLLSERPRGEFKRSFLVKNIDREKIQASYDEGVLSIHLPRIEESKPLRISVGEKKNDG